jgi:hypothetical protein
VSVFAVQTTELVENTKGELFHFKNQLKYLENLEIYISSISRTKCTMAYTNLKTLLFYKPGFRMLSLLSEFKVYPNSQIKNKFQLFWANHYSEQLDMIDKENTIKTKRNNVKRYLRVLTYILMFFINMKIAHRRKLRAMEKSDLEEDDEVIEETNLKTKRFGFFGRKKKIDSVRLIRFEMSIFSIRWSVQKIVDIEELLTNPTVQLKKKMSIIYWNCNQEGFPIEKID